MSHAIVVHGRLSSHMWCMQMTIFLILSWNTIIQKFYVVKLIQKICLVSFFYWVIINEKEKTAVLFNYIVGVKRPTFFWRCVSRCVILCCSFTKDIWIWAFILLGSRTKKFIKWGLWVKLWLHYSAFFLIRCNYLRPWLSSNRLKLQRKVTKTNYPDFFLISAINTREKQ